MVTMNSDKQVVVLTNEQMTFLRRALFPPEWLKVSIATAQLVSTDRWSLTMTRTAAEEARSIFTNRLAEVGFDSDYKPTQEGALLEGLIDSFFLDKVE